MEHKAYYKALADALKKGEVERRTIVQGPALGDEALFIDGSMFATLSNEEHTYSRDDEAFVEHLASKVELVIFGGGHVALELYHIAIRLELEITIIDEREEFCNNERFPKATCIAAPFISVFTRPQNWIRPYFVIATRGHSFDQLCLEHVLKIDHWYIGMIGSKAKVEKTFSNLKQKGFSDAELACVHAPIGLAINAASAAEIALSILGEIVAHYRKRKTSTFLDTRVFRRMIEEEHYILVRIIAKTGSAPCQIGFQLAYFLDHTFEGTVGGGELEALALGEARKMLDDCTICDHIKTFCLDATKASSLGMICGGDVTLLFQRR